MKACTLCIFVIFLNIVELNSADNTQIKRYDKAVNKET